MRPRRHGVRIPRVREPILMTHRSGVANFLAAERSSTGLRQKVGARTVALTSFVILLVAASAWFTARRTMGPDSDAEIAVIVSQINTVTWPRLVTSFKRVAERHGWAVTEASESPGRLRIVFGDGGSILFRLYK